MDGPGCGYMQGEAMELASLVMGLARSELVQPWFIAEAWDDDGSGFRAEGRDVGCGGRVRARLCS